MNRNKSLFEKFLDFNQKHKLTSSKKKTLLAVSGGIDSVVMCHLFQEAGLAFAIAHANFQLRGEEAEGDEQFVQSIAASYSVDFFSKKFDTLNYAAEKNISVQVAARELRYEWFLKLLTNSEIKTGKQLHKVATAHHLNDNIETILFNFTKGAGIRGLRGIPVNQNKVIRPLLFASREDIELYCAAHQLSFRTDSSNSSDKYTRNKIRNNIIPLLKEINPSLEETLSDKIELLGYLENLYDSDVKKKANQLFLHRGSDIYIPLLKLKKTAGAKQVLFELLKQYGFNSAQTQDIYEATDAEAGKQFLSTKARVIKDRRFFILTELKKLNDSIQHIYEGNGELKVHEQVLSFSTTGMNPNIKFNNPKSVAMLDKSKLEFPLIVRHWKVGDYFYPFGMKLKKKKLKKFFADEKIAVHQKEKIVVVESNKKIVWVAGYRIDERYKITSNTTDVFKMEIK